MTNDNRLAHDMFDSPISPIEDILEDARNGRPYILVDAEDRENEGDVIIPAQFATPDQINFMARHARGLICLAITAERARQLRLPPMAAENRESMGTAFTVSIEATEGVTTGISAADRARTVAGRGRSDQGRRRHRLARPRLPAGRRATAACWSARAIPRRPSTSAAWPGLTPAGVICEIMNDDGDHGAHAGPGRLRPAARPEDRHHRRPDRLSPPHRALCRAGHGHAVRERPRRAVPPDALPEHHRGRRARRPGQGPDRAGQADAGAHAPGRFRRRHAGPCRGAPELCPRRPEGDQRA